MLRVFNGLAIPRKVPLLYEWLDGSGISKMAKYFRQNTCFKPSDLAMTIRVSLLRSQVVPAKKTVTPPCREAPASPPNSQAIEPGDLLVLIGASTGLRITTWASA